MTARPATRAQRGTYSSPRQEARQRRILEAARQEISRCGYDAITMQGLADAADVSTKTLYNLYGTRDELLLEAVSDLLGNLEHQPAVVQAEPGIPRLLAFCDSAFEQVERTPRYAEVMARTLYQASPGHKLVDALLGNTLRAATAALSVEQEQGGFTRAVDIAALADVLVAEQWGLILMWSKGLVALEDIRSRARRSHWMILLPLCTASRREALRSLSTGDEPL